MGFNISKANTKGQSGFTIVELLIVIVVIGILAAITIVAYTGITQQAKESVAKNSIASAQKKLTTWYIQNSETYPADLDEAGILGSGGIDYQYTVNNATNPKGYCVTVTANDIAYRLGKNYTYTTTSTNTLNESNPISGVCPGHSSSADLAITNLQPNPGLEVNESGFGQPNSSAVARDTSRARTGAASLRVTMPANPSSGVVGASVTAGQAVGAYIIQPNAAYTISAYVYVPTGTVDPYISIQGAGHATRANPPEHSTSLKNQWVRIHNTFTTNASGTLSLYILNRQATPTAGTQFWIDDIMITEGESAQPPVYADGNSAGWVWNGVAGLSSSKGPAL